MIVLLASRADEASLGLADAVTRARAFSAPAGEPGLLVRRTLEPPAFALVEIDEMHIHAEAVDARVAKALGRAPEAILVLSRHRSEAGTPALTVHAVGNWGPEARFGGAPRRLTPPAPRLAAAVLRALARAAPAGYQVTYEATHHGPLLSVPTAYVEVGSGEKEWRDRAAADAIAAAVLGAPAAADEARGLPVLLGVGGGHYAPRFTDLARRGRAACGHILPSYALAHVDEETLRAAAVGHDAFVVDARGQPAGLEGVVATLRGLLDEAQP